MLDSIFGNKKEQSTSAWIRDSIFENGEISVDEVVLKMGKELSFKNRFCARQLIIDKNVKGRIEKQGATLSCSKGRYFIIEDNKDAENEAIKRKNNTLGYLNTAKRCFTNLEKSNPEYIDKLIEASHEILQKALEFKINITRKLKG